MKANVDVGRGVDPKDACLALIGVLERKAAASKCAAKLKRVRMVREALERVA